MKYSKSLHSGLLQPCKCYARVLMTGSDVDTTMHYRITSLKCFIAQAQQSVLQTFLYSSLMFKRGELYFQVVSSLSHILRRASDVSTSRYVPAFLANVGLGYVCRKVAKSFIRSNLSCSLYYRSFNIVNYDRKVCFSLKRVYDRNLQTYSHNLQS